MSAMYNRSCPQCGSSDNTSFFDNCSECGASLDGPAPVVPVRDPPRRRWRWLGYGGTALAAMGLSVGVGVALMSPDRPVSSNPPVVKLSVGSSLCTAFPVKGPDGHVYLASAWHCVDKGFKQLGKPPNIDVAVDDAGQELVYSDARVVGADMVADVVLLYNEAFEAKNREVVEPLALSAAPCGDGNASRILSYRPSPSGGYTYSDKTITSAVADPFSAIDVAAPYRRELRPAIEGCTLTPNVEHGESGSPVVNAANEVVGLVVMKVTMAGAEPIGVAVDRQYLAALLERASPSAPEPTQADAVRLYRDILEEFIPNWNRHDWARSLADILYPPLIHYTSKKLGEQVGPIGDTIAKATDPLTVYRALSLWRVLLEALEGKYPQLADYLLGSPERKAPIEACLKEIKSANDLTNCLTDAPARYLVVKAIEADVARGPKDPGEAPLTLVEPNYEWEVSMRPRPGTPGQTNFRLISDLGRQWFVPSSFQTMIDANLEQVGRVVEATWAVEGPWIDDVLPRLAGAWTAQVVFTADGMRQRQNYAFTISVGLTISVNGSMRDWRSEQELQIVDSSARRLGTNGLAMELTLRAPSGETLKKSLTMTLDRRGNWQLNDGTSSSVVKPAQT